MRVRSLHILMFLLIFLTSMYTIPATEIMKELNQTKYSSAGKSLDYGLVAYWDFDEGSGNILHDVSGNGNNGTIYGAKWVDGVKGKALSFDGVDDYVNVKRTADFNFGYSDFTFTVWVKCASITYHIQQILWNGFNPEIQLNSDGYIVSFFHEGGHGVMKGQKVSPNVWYFIALVRHNDVGYLYINAMLVNTSTDAHYDCSSSYDFTMGHDPGVGDEYLTGDIDEVRIYNRALSAEEIKELYDSVPHPPSPPRNLDAVRGDGYVLLSWEAPEDDGGVHITSYRIYRNDVMYREVGANTYSFNDTNVSVKSTYSYYVVAVNGVGESDKSNEVDVNWDIPAEPRDLTAGRGDGYVLLSWEPPSDDGGSHITGYRIYRWDGCRWVLVGETDDTSYRIFEASLFGEEMKYKVVAVNDVGEGEAAYIYVHKPIVYHLWAVIILVIILIIVAYLWTKRYLREKREYEEAKREVLKELEELIRR